MRGPAATQAKNLVDHIFYDILSYLFCKKAVQKVACENIHFFSLFAAGDVTDVYQKALS